MTVQELEKVEGKNPASAEEARALIKRVVSLFMPWNIDGLVNGFTPECVVRFGTLPEIRGAAALRSFLEARRSKQKNYRLKKELRTLADDTMTNVWEGEWDDAETGTAMKGFGVEFWKLEGGKIAVWEAAFNTAPAADVGNVSKPFG
jgi:nuclear transport factor 2 (NTF2) superfamily protein